MEEIKIWCDGGSRNNGKEDNVGGWAFFMAYKTSILSLKDYEFNTTNNIQEIKALINALKHVKTTHIPVVVYADSQYVIKSITEWRKGWESRGWKTANKTPVKNKKLLQELFALHDQQENIRYEWVKGHAENEGNNIADKLANEAMDEGEGSRLR